MKKLLQDLKSGITIGVGILLTIFIGLFVYAELTGVWTNPNELEAHPGDTLTSEKWNAILSNQIVLGSANMDVTQSVNINRPDTWTPGIEYDFGDGLYGYRFVGNANIAANTQWNTYVNGGIQNIQGSNLINYGGYYNRGDGARQSLMASITSNNLSTASYGGVSLGWPNKYLGFATISQRDRTSGNNEFDVWALYIKN